MLTEIIKDAISLSYTSNEPIFDTVTSFEEIQDAYKNHIQLWAAMDNVEQSKFGSIEAFLMQKGIDDPRSPHLIPAKNLFLIRTEVKKE